MSKRFLITLGTLVVIGIAATMAIFLAKGYTFSSKERRIVGTGIISVNSSPEAASVFVDGHLTTATNATISSLPPKEYIIRIVKEGYIPWEKKVIVKEGIVSDLKITLFPSFPTIYPLTLSGAKNPVLSPDGEKLAYIVSSGKKPGIWVWTLKSDQPIAFARGAQPHQIVSSTSSGVDFSNAQLHWSPDSKQVLASLGELSKEGSPSNFYLLDADNFNGDPRDVTAIITSTMKSWADDIKIKNEARILAVKDLDSRKIASDAASLNWSPDETKFLFTEGKTDLKLYDLETKSQYEVPEAKAHFWLPDSRHVVLVDQDQVSIVDLDGTNKAVIYAGKFEDSFVFAWPDSSRLVFITSFPTPTASLPNLYGINLK